MTNEKKKPKAGQPKRCTCGAARASIFEVFRGDGERPQGYIVERGRIMHGPKCEILAKAAK